MMVQPRHALTRDWMFPALLSAVWLIMVILANPIGEFPLNDDWVYALAVKSVLSTGYYQFPSISSANVGPQVYWGALFCLPFGFSFTALRISTLVLAWLGVVYFYRLVRLTGCSPGKSFLAGCAMALNPLYFVLANTYLTDVPFCAVMVISMYYFAVGVDRDSAGYIGVGLLLAMASILIRQVGEVLPPAYAIVLLARYGVSVKRLAAAALFVAFAVGLHLAYQYWMVHTGRVGLSPHSDPNNLVKSALSAREWRQTAFKVVNYIGFLTLPLLSAWMLFRQGSLARRPQMSQVAGIALLGSALLLALWLTKSGLPSLQNVVTPAEVGPLTLRDRYLLGLNRTATPAWLDTAWWLVTAASAYAGITMLAVAVWLARSVLFKQYGRLPQPQRSGLLLALCVTGGYCMLLTYVGRQFEVFDRYVLPLLPLFLLTLCWLDDRNQRRLSKWRAVPAGAVLAFYAFYSACGAHDYLAWNRARWDLVQELQVQRGIAAKQIDGGYEVNGWFLASDSYVARPGKSYWWVDDDEYLVTFGPVPGYDVLSRRPVQSWLNPNRREVLALKRRVPAN